MTKPAKIDAVRLVRLLRALDEAQVFCIRPAMFKELVDKAEQQVDIGREAFWVPERTWWGKD